MRFLFIRIDIFHILTRVKPPIYLKKEKTMTDIILGTIYMIVIIAFIYHIFSGNVNR
jgi:hypothetical protein